MLPRYLTKLTYALLITAGVCGFASQSSAFSTVINLPSDPAPTEIGSDTQLNVLAGGLLPSSFSQRFQAGLPDDTSNDVEVNISDGVVGDYFTGNAGSITKVSGGQVGDSLLIRGGGAIEVSGGAIGSDFTLDAGSAASISGGSIGSFASVSGSSLLTISDGVVHSLFAADNSVINVSGGEITEGGIFDTGAILTISGGEIRSFFSVIDATLIIDGGSAENAFLDLDSSLLISDGTLTGADIQQGRLDMSGGELAGEVFVSGTSDAQISGGLVSGDLRAIFGAHVELLGQSFSLNGSPISGLINPGDSLIVDARGGAILSGVLADGSPIDFALNETSIPGQDQFSADSTLRLTLVPEPSTMGIMAITCLSLAASRKKMAMRYG